MSATNAVVVQWGDAVSFPYYGYLHQSTPCRCTASPFRVDRTTQFFASSKVLMVHVHGWILLCGGFIPLLQVRKHCQKSWGNVNGASIENNPFYPCDYVPGLYLHHGNQISHLYASISYCIFGIAMDRYVPATIQCQVQKIDGWENSDDLFASMTMEKTNWQVREFQWAWWHDELLGRTKKWGSSTPKSVRLIETDEPGINRIQFRLLPDQGPSAAHAKTHECPGHVHAMSWTWSGACLNDDSVISGASTMPSPVIHVPVMLLVMFHWPLCLGCLCCRNVLDVPVVPQNLWWIIFSVVKTGELTSISQVAKPK